MTFLQPVSICIPCGDSVKAEFSLCLANLMKKLGQDGVGTWVHMRKGSLIAAQRQRLAEEAMSVGSHGILWLDSDMTFPSDIYHQLMRREKAIVGAAYSVKDESGDSTAMIDHDGTLERVNAGTGLRRVDACGFGALFTDITVFEQMPRPWFQTTYDYEYEYHNGEDVFFCEQARDRGYDIWVDMDLSKQIGHVGSKDYKL